jgi:hypothetical protein
MSENVLYISGGPTLSQRVAIDEPRVPRNDAELEQLLERTQRLLDERNAERFAGQSGAQIVREAERRNADAVLSRDDSLPGGFRIRFVPKHVPAYLSEHHTSAFLRRQAD